ncbi:MAG: hypothetical protein QW406_06000, partial [Ignisphaera sp.]
TIPSEVNMSEVLSKEEKLRILKTLEEDVEFRYAMAGALGVLEILKRLDTIESRLEENSKRLELIEKRLEEHSRILQEHSKRLEEHSRILQEHSKRLEEVTKTLNILVTKIGEHSEKINGLRREVSSLSLVVGALTESFYAKSVYEDIEREVLKRGEKVLERIRNARIDDVDIDLLVETDRVVYIIEVKVRPEYEDVGRLIAKIDIAKKHYPEKNIVGILAGAMIGKEIEAYARGKEIKVYTY